jgi:hypothetical protein
MLKLNKCVYILEIKPFQIEIKDIPLPFLLYLFNCMHRSYLIENHSKSDYR